MSGRTRCRGLVGAGRLRLLQYPGECPFPVGAGAAVVGLALTALWHSGRVPARYALPAMALALIALGVLRPFAVGRWD